MEIVLIVAAVIATAAVLYVALTLGVRTKQITGPLLDDAVKDIFERFDALANDVRRQLAAMAEDQQRDRDQAKLDGRKIQGRLDHADNRMSNLGSQVLAELETVRRLGENTEQRVAALSVPGADDESTVTSVPETPTPARLYVERLRFAVVPAPSQSSSSQSSSPQSSSRPERQIRLLVERYVGELSNPQLGDLGDAPAIIARAKNDPGFREKLNAIAADYFATRWGDRAFAAAAERWVTRDVFPETAGAEVGNGLGPGLTAVVARPLEPSGAELRLPGSVAGSALVLYPATEPLAQLITFFEVTGVVVGTAAGFHPLVLTAARAFAQDEFHDLDAPGLGEAARKVYGGPEPRAEDPTTELSRTQPPNTWWEPQPRPRDPA